MLASLHDAVFASFAISGAIIVWVISFILSMEQLAEQGKPLPLVALAFITLAGLILFALVCMGRVEGL
jgi:hypothetical protein